MTDKAFITCLWFDTEGEAAANYYAGIFKDSKIGRVSRYTEAGPGPAGSVQTVEFELNGQKFVALNGGPQYKFNAAVSVMVPCEDQAEVDYYWSSSPRAARKSRAAGWWTSSGCPGRSSPPSSWTWSPIPTRRRCGGSPRPCSR